MDSVLKPGDRLIVVSEDDDTIKTSAPGAVDQNAIQLRAAAPAGWSHGSGSGIVRTSRV